MNLIERRFGKLTDKALRRGIFNNVPELIAAIEAYLETTNNDPSHSSRQPPPTRSSPRSAAAASPSTQSRPKLRHSTEPDSSRLAGIRSSTPGPHR
jgi:hypothetical protein